VGDRPLRRSVEDLRNNNAAPGYFPAV